MDAMKAILSRRSIRKFGSASINETDIHELLDATNECPFFVQRTAVAFHCHH